MAQSALTVTPANPTPPTNLSSGGWTPPSDPAQVAADDGIAIHVPNSTTAGANNGNTLNEPSGSRIVFAAKTAVAGTAGYTSVDNEGRGTEASSTATSTNPNPIGQLQMVSCLGNYVSIGNIAGVGNSINQAHASTLSGTAVPTLSGATGASNVSGIGVTTLTATGTNYNRGSVINVSGVPQNTTYVSATSLTASSVVKRTTAGTLPVTVTSNGLTTAPVNWTLT
jgi:hypothetical protein